MGKEEASEMLRKNGYTSSVVNGVVLAEIKDRNTFSEITGLLRESGYRSSYGTIAKLPDRADW